MARKSRLTDTQLVTQRAITEALNTAARNSGNARKYAACIDYAARHIDRLRDGIDTINPSDRLTQ